MREFKGKVAVITGAASGIGRALAERFAAEGMKVVLADIEEDALINTEKEMRQKGSIVKSVITDVSNANDVQTLARKTVEQFGAVHVLCNNAGVFGDFSLLWEKNTQDWDWVLGVNLWGVIHGIRAFVPIMIEQDEEGHVVNTSSMAGLFSMPMVSLYHVSKHAVITLSESLHHELSLQKSKVNVSVLCPGMVKTKFVDSERNRPEELRTQEKEPNEMRQMWHDAYEEFMAGGMDASEVAQITIDAIKDNKFYIFPSKGPLGIARSRMDRLLEEQNPTIDLPEPMLRRLGIS